MARETPQQEEPVMLRRPRSPIIAGLTLNTMVQHPQFFDEGKVSDQQQYELGLPPLDPQDDERSPNQERYQKAIAYLMQSRGHRGGAQADSVAIAP